jgi:hypothetical protein
MLLLPGIAFACSCAPLPTVLDAYDRSDVVMIVRVLSVERVNEEETRSTKFTVEKVYKGKVRAGDELVFAQGDGANCIMMFSETNIGDRFLFYVGLPPSDSKYWFAFVCGRSGALKSATEDLLYLDKLDQVRGKTRVSGKYRAMQGLNVANRTIRIVGRDNTYETKTDKDGVFEIYDLPPGEYRLEPEIPAGWKLYEKSVTFTLKPQKHSSIDLTFARVTDAP